MVRRSFRGASAHLADEDEPGLGSFSLFLQRDEGLSPLAAGQAFFPTTVRDHGE